MIDGAAMPKEVDVVDVTLLSSSWAVKVYVPASLTMVLSKMATPFWTLTVVVPLRVPPVGPVLTMSIVTCEESVVTTLPNASSTATTGGV